MAVAPSADPKFFADTLRKIADQIEAGRIEVDNMLVNAELYEGPLREDSSAYGIIIRRRMEVVYRNEVVL